MLQSCQISITTQSQNTGIALPTDLPEISSFDTRLQNIVSAAPSLAMIVFFLFIAVPVYGWLIIYGSFY